MKPKPKPKPCPTVGDTVYTRHDPHGQWEAIIELVVTKVGNGWFYARPVDGGQSRKFSRANWREYTHLGPGPAAMDEAEYAEYQAYWKAVARLKATGYRVTGTSYARSMADLTAAQINAIAEIIEG